MKPFKPGPPGVTLSKADLEKLRKGDAVRQQLNAGSGGRGLVVQDVHAPPEVVWGRILDFPAYTRMVGVGWVPPQGRGGRTPHWTRQVVDRDDGLRWCSQVPRVTICENYLVRDKLMEVGLPVMTRGSSPSAS